ncbi:hypothetical protein STEG23_025755 [Scotinomys teguina]
MASYQPQDTDLQVLNLRRGEHNGRGGGKTNNGTDTAFLLVVLSVVIYTSHRELKPSRNFSVHFVMSPGVVLIQLMLEELH